MEFYLFLLLYDLKDSKIDICHINISEVSLVIARMSFGFFPKFVWHNRGALILINIGFLRTYEA